MTAVSPVLIIELVILALTYLIMVDFIKIRIFSYFNLRYPLK